MCKDVKNITEELRKPQKIHIICHVNVIAEKAPGVDSELAGDEIPVESPRSEEEFSEVAEVATDNADLSLHG